MQIGRYDFDRLKDTAIQNPSNENCLNLFHWFEQFDPDDWNGECFSVDKDHDLYPIYNITYDQDGEIDECELVGAELK